MFYQRKYQKYVHKILKLRNQIGGIRRVNVIQNNGTIHGITNQSIFISILTYLQQHGFPRLNLTELRTQGSLNQSTEHTMFDSFNRTFINAINRIAQLYSLQIVVYTVNHAGYLIHEHTTIINRGGTNIVNIAQYGLYHFQLITDIIDEVNPLDAHLFIPAVRVGERLVSVTELRGPPNKIQARLELSERQLEYEETVRYLETLRNIIEQNEVAYNQLLETKKGYEKSTEIDSNIKHTLILDLEVDLKNMESQIELQRNEHEKLQQLTQLLRTRINQLGTIVLID